MKTARFGLLLKIEIYRCTPFQASPESKSECNLRFESLNEYLFAELRSGLVEMLNRIKFPFEEAVDYNSLKVKLRKTADAFGALYIHNKQAGCDNDDRCSHYTSLLSSSCGV